MIYVKLFFEFLKIGLFSFGGAYGAIPLIQEVASVNSWADAEMFANLVALSEVTPGPIMVNMATYIGSSQAGFWGALFSTAGVIFPSFTIIIMVTILFKNILKKKSVQAVFKGIKSCFIGLFLATGISMAISIITLNGSVFMDLPAFLIFLFLSTVIFFHHKFRKKEFPPIILILLAAICGCILY